MKLQFVLSLALAGTLSVAQSGPGFGGGSGGAGGWGGNSAEFPSCAVSPIPTLLCDFRC